MRKFSDNIHRVPYGAYDGKTAQYESALADCRAKNKVPVTVKPTVTKPVMVKGKLVTCGVVIFVA